MDDITTKICTKCNTEKSLSLFNNQKSGKYGKHSQCRECIKEYSKSRADIRHEQSRKNYQLNKDKILVKQKKYYHDNKEKVSQRSKEYYKNNKERINDRNNVYYDCHKEEHATRTKKWREEHPKEMAELQKNWAKENKDKLKIHQKKYKTLNRDKVRISQRNSRLKHIDKTKRREKIYRINNKDKINARTRNRRKTDPQFVIKDRLRARLREFLATYDARRSHANAKLMGCSIEELINYFKTLFYPNKLGIMMSESHLCTAEINVDHLIPCWKFNLSNPEEQLRCFHYSNLQPLWVEDHKIKSKKDRKEYDEWKRSGLPLDIYLDPIKKQKALDPYNAWL